MEPNPGLFVSHLVDVFGDIKPILKPTGSVYVVLGDTYCSSGKWGGQVAQTIRNGNERDFPAGKRPPGVVKPDGRWIQRKQLLLIPSRFAAAMQDRGWILRNDIIWNKTNSLPSSVKDRLSNRYEHIFHFVKSERYYYNLEAIREPYKPSSFQRFRGLVHQNFIKSQSKYALLKPPPGTQFTEGKTPVPAWLEAAARGSGKKRTMKKIEQLYVLSKGAVGHGHYAGGDYRGIRTSHIGKNPGDVWNLSVSSFHGAHFSVYPEQLCVKPILSSCPQWVCKKCGAPRREVAGRAARLGTAFNIRVRDAKKGILEKKWAGRFKASAPSVQQYREFFYETRPKERVLAAGCSCNAEFQPGVVLDPFVGSGTTMKVALELGRSAVGIEINPDYVPLITQRIPQLKDEDILLLHSEKAMQGRHSPASTFLSSAA